MNIGICHAFQIYVYCSDTKHRLALRCTGFHISGMCFYLLVFYTLKYKIHLIVLIKFEFKPYQIFPIRIYRPVHFRSHLFIDVATEEVSIKEQTNNQSHF